MSKVPSQSIASYWQHDAKLSLPLLDRDLNVDICIVGAGIAGLTTAYLLQKEGRQVTLLDANGVGFGETGNTTAHLASAIDERFTELEKLFGEKGARLAANSHREAIDRIESICREEAIDCSFERLDAYLFAARESDADWIDREFAAAKRAGFDDCERLDRTPFLSAQTGPSLRFRDQAQIHPLRYAEGLFRAFSRLGGRTLAGASVTQVDESASPSVVTSGGHRVQAKALVLATNTPINDRFIIHSKQHAYRSYVIALAWPDSTMPHTLFWDTLDPYHYVRMQTQSDESQVLIVGGEDHKVGQDTHPEDRFIRLETWARRYFPQAGSVLHAWSGQIIEPVDGLAYIGRNPGSAGPVFIATGDSGNGMTHGTIAGLLIRDLILERDNPWTELYDPARKNFHFNSLKEYVGQNANVAVQYRDYFTGGEIADLRNLQRGESAIVRQGLRKLAVSCDQNGQLSCFSAVCPHLGGIVHWNDLEQTWDCPAHGSRFDRKGNIVNGPSLSGLQPISLEELSAKPKKSKDSRERREGEDGRRYSSTPGL